MHIKPAKMVSLSAKTVVVCRFGPFEAKNAPVILCQNSPFGWQKQPWQAILALLWPKQPQFYYVKIALGGQNGRFEFSIHKTALKKELKWPHVGLKQPWQSHFSSCRGQNSPNYKKPKRPLNLLCVLLKIREKVT